jgi:hypothetical protein
MFIRVLQNDPNWHTLDCLPVPYAIDRKKLATMGGRSRPSLQCRTAQFLSWARVSLSVCELRHMALPRIDLLCRFSLDCDPPPMTGPFFEKRRPPARAGLARALVRTDRP